MRGGSRNSTIGTSGFRIISYKGEGSVHGAGTLRALREALGSSADGLMIDTWLSADYRWVVPAVARVDEAFACRIHSLPARRIEANPLETVLALFSAIGGKKELYLDIRDEGRISDIIKMLEGYGILEKTTIVSWYPLALEAIHDIEPRLKLAYSWNPDAQAARKLVIHKRSRKGIFLRFHPLASYHAGKRIRAPPRALPRLPQVPLSALFIPKFLCSSQFIGRAHEEGIAAYAYLVTTGLTRHLVRRFGADGVLADSIPQ